MRVSKRGQITIPKHLRERYGMTHNVDAEITPTEKGQLIQKSTPAEHPVDSIVGILDGVVDDDFDIDEYIEEIRGR